MNNFEHTIKFCGVISHHIGSITVYIKSVCKICTGLGEGIGASEQFLGVVSRKYFRFSGEIWWNIDICVTACSNFGLQNKSI